MLNFGSFKTRVNAYTVSIAILMFVYFTQELEKERSKAGEWEGVAETHINQIHRLKSRLSQKSMKVDNLSAALAMKEAITTKRSL